MTAAQQKQKLLVLELWGLGDLAMASTFIQAATKKFEVTVVAKVYGQDLQARYWPEAKLVCTTLPWTAFRKKYHLWNWPWKLLFRLVLGLRRERFDIAVSARWDPRDHFLMWLINARKRLGFPRTGSQLFLSKPLKRDSGAHRYEYWRTLGTQLGLQLPNPKNLPVPINRGRLVIIHTGGSQPSKIWPLQNFKDLAHHLRSKKFLVLIVCDAPQRDWWLTHGEKGVITPKNVSELITILDSAAMFIGNDSGPGHVAAVHGLATLSIFGPGRPSEFLPVHPLAEFIEGKPCAYKPCNDYCRFSVPNCLYNISVSEVVKRAETFLDRNQPTQ